MEEKNKNIAIVGAGIGGLATAVRLASRGYQVDVYEKLPESGGRAHMIEDRGFKFDTGPSFVLMPDFFREIFKYNNERLEDYLDLKMLDVQYQIFYADGEKLTVYNDAEKTRKELERFEQGSAHAYNLFISHIAKFYDAVEPLLYKCFTVKDLFKPATFKMLFQLSPFQTYWQIAKKYFKDDRICFAMTFEAMFIGVSPYKTPAFYSVITYADHVQKIYHPIGGMYQIPLALECMGRKHQVRYHFNCEIQSIEKNQGKFILKTHDKEFSADKVVINADYATAQTKLLQRRLPRYDYSCSVYLLYLGLKKKVDGLEHHNLFFAEDLEKNLREIFEDKIPPLDPSFYIHVPTKTDPTLAPEGKDILYLLIPVPNLDGARTDFADYEDQLRKIVFDRIRQRIGVNVEDLIEVEHRFCPKDFITRYNIQYGATFGLAHTLMQSAFLRPPNKDSKIDGLYYVGASTQPGGGVPPVIASSRIVSDLIIKDSEKD